MSWIRIEQKYTGGGAQFDGVCENTNDLTSAAAGDKVHYPTKDDSVYVSIVDNNVWAPDVYGWEEVV